jgi:hypothetical protein
MRKRTVLLMLVLSWPLLLVCNQTIMVTWAQNSRDSIMALGVSASLLYVGLDLAISPETSLPYRTRLPGSWTTLTSVRVSGIVLVVGSLVLGWAALGHLFGFIKP